VKKKLLKLMRVLTACLMTSWLVSCAGDYQKASIPVTKSQGIDLCHAGIMPFSLEPDEHVDRDNLKKMVAINMLLAERCGIK